MVNFNHIGNSVAYNFKGSFNILKDLTAAKADVDNVQIDGNSIISTDTNGVLNLTPNGTGDLVLDGLKWPQADGTANQILYTNGSAQIAWKNQQIVDQEGYTFNPNGFQDPDTDVQVSFVDGTRTLTIQPAVTSFKYWSEGQVYTKTGSENIVIANTEGNHYVYYNGSSLAETTTWSTDLILKYSLVAVIHWDATNSKQIYFGDEYKHTTQMGSRTHLYLHDTRGYALETGGGLTDIVADGSGDVNSSAQFGCERTIAFDEDAEFDLTARASTSNIAVYYKSGADASNIWRVDETASFGVLTTGTGRAAYNELTGGNWVQTEIGNLNFVLAHIFTYNDSTRRFGVIQGENEYSTLISARDGAYVEINNIVIDGLVGPEIKFLGTIIYQTSNTYANTVKSRIRSTDTGDDYIDLRDESITRGGVAGTLTDHGALTGLGDDDHTQYLLADGTRTLSGTFTHDGISSGYTGSQNVSKQYGVTTSDATITQIAAITLDTNTMVSVEARVSGFIDDYSASLTGFIRYTARRVAGGAIETSAPIIDVQEDSSGSPTVDADVSGNDVRILVQGIAAENWVWVATVNYNFVKTSA